MTSQPGLNIYIGRGNDNSQPSQVPINLSSQQNQEPTDSTRTQDDLIDRSKVQPPGPQDQGQLQLPSQRSRAMNLDLVFDHTVPSRSTLHPPRGEDPQDWLDTIIRPTQQNVHLPVPELPERPGSPTVGTALSSLKKDDLKAQTQEYFEKLSSSEKALTEMYDKLVSVTNQALHAQQLCILFEDQLAHKACQVKAL